MSTLHRVASRLFKTKVEQIDPKTLIHVHDFESEFQQKYISTTLNPLGEGSHGKVYRAWDTQSKTVVAIKKSERRANYDTLPHEFDLLISLQRHPNILYPSSLHYLPCHVVLVMPLAGPSTLESLAPIGEQDLKPLIHQLLSALQFLHLNGISHNDVKPSNVLVDLDATTQRRWSSVNTGVRTSARLQSKKLTKARVRLCDFGLADRHCEASIAQAGNIGLWTAVCAGTPSFMAAERFNMELHDARKSDMFSFGITVFETLTDRQAFTEEPPQRGSWYLGNRQNADKTDIKRAERFLDDRRSTTWICKVLGRVSAGTYAGRSRHSLFPAMLDLLIECLAYDPAKRPCASRALEHILFNECTAKKIAAKSRQGRIVTMH